MGWVELAKSAVITISTCTIQPDAAPHFVACFDARGQSIAVGSHAGKVAIFSTTDLKVSAHITSSRICTAYEVS